MRVKTTCYASIVLTAFFTAGCKQSQSPSGDDVSPAVSRDTRIEPTQDDVTPSNLNNAIDEPKPLNDISDISQLQEAFNQDRNNTRLILLFSPT